MKHVKYLVLGSGPAGLTFANRLLQLGEESFLVLEKESEAGGLCRSTQVDGTDLDIGGGHFLDVRRPKVNEFLFGFMPEKEWNKFSRDSRIVLKHDTVHHPLEANIWEMGIDSQVQYLKSIARAGCNIGKEMPSKFTDWIYWKLGDRIAEDYMIPYNQKIFSKELDELGTYWLDKLPNVSFEDTLRSCLEHKAYGEQPGHAEFYYPKEHGYGELWLRMADALGDRIIYNAPVTKMNIEKKEIHIAGDCEVYSADCIITTIPWTSIREYEDTLPELVDAIKYLKHSSVEIKYVPENLDTPAHWLYCPSQELSYHRILVRSNFCANSKGYWTETNGERVIESDTEMEGCFMNEYAYPLNTIEKPEKIAFILQHCKENGIIGLGRWGEHQHFNSDAVVERSLKLAEELV